MEDQFLYAELMPSIILIIVALACAEFIGKSKHIGFNYTLFMMLGIIPGIIALIFSPSAKKPPTKANKNYILFAVLFAIFSLIQLYKIQGEHDIPIATYMVMISFFATTFYFWDLQNGLVINKFPKYYFENNSKTENRIEVFSENNELYKIDSLKNLKEKGILTELEFIEKSEILNNEILQKQTKHTEEYKQLKYLYDSDILTEEEFESKVEILKRKKTEKNILIINKDYGIVDGYSEGLALVINDNLDYGYINADGKVVIDFIFEHAENFSNGIAKVRIGGEFKNIDYNGKTVG